MQKKPISLGISRDSKSAALFSLEEDATEKTQRLALYLRAMHHRTIKIALEIDAMNHSYLDMDLDIYAVSA